VLWRADDRAEQVSAVLRSARRLSAEDGWLLPIGEAAG
jgi:hypothetical protein